MALTYDKIIHTVESETSGTLYEVRVRSDGKHWWLSCQCGAWTRGKHNNGKEVWQRKCKHTDATLLERRTALAELGVDIQRGDSKVIFNKDTTNIEVFREPRTISTGFDRRVIK